VILELVLILLFINFLFNLIFLYVKSKNSASIKSDIKKESFVDDAEDEFDSKILFMKSKLVSVLDRCHDIQTKIFEMKRFLLKSQELNLMHGTRILYV